MLEKAVGMTAFCGFGKILLVLIVIIQNIERSYIQESEDNDMKNKKETSVVFLDVDGVLNTKKHLCVCPIRSICRS